ncbi:cupin domain-containing protein [Arcticibacter tournemirensis]
MNDKTEVIHGHVVNQIIKDDGIFPNNPNLPVMVYKGAIQLHPDDEPECILALFEKNNWKNGWKNGIYDYHHYHSNTHEVLGIFCGVADVQLGGPEGICVELNRGDVVVLPAGVAHKSLSSSDDFLCVGAYPVGAEYDINYGEENERARAIENISKVKVPLLDPVYGESGPLPEHWNFQH